MSDKNACLVKNGIVFYSHITLLVRDVQCNQNRLCHRIKLYAGGDTRMPEYLHIGNLLQVEASVSSFSKPVNAGQFNEYQYNTEQGISYKGFIRKCAG